LKTKGATSEPGLTDEEMREFLAEWLDQYNPTDFEGAFHKLIAKRAVRALATPNNERLAQLIDKLVRVRWRIKVTPKAGTPIFQKPGKEAV